ncbi:MULTISPECIES: tetratricopeptide repeat protein [Sphingomonas]|uniref:tetratricopeptide repeat protein n=1 Tax=Sphingomonas TaxID=13687 RepID=UPI000DEF6AC0|nr:MULTISPECIES: tetratricopeptide repeat protein [Sphingomonas]
MRSLLASTAILLLAVSGPAAAQQRQISPEQRIERLERQVRQLQGRIFPKGQPVDTAGLADDPAASQVVVTALSNRLDNIERSLTEITRTNEENAQRIGTLEAELARAKADNDQRLRALENAPPPAAATTTTTATTPAADDRPTTDRPPTAKPERPRPTPVASAPVAPPKTGDLNTDAEAAYDVGYQLWQQKKYDQAIAALRAMASSFPTHRRVSWANNLAGRALLDKGEYRAAAEALLANYRGNPRGERAPDSLYYLGQALMGLKQPSQACKAYAELDQVYGDKVRPDLRALVTPAKAKAGCR